MSTKSKTLPQNNLITLLSDAAKQYPRAEKILIVPDRTTGNHILQNLARAGTPWINFDIKTVTLLAVELVEDRLIAEKLQAISSIGSQAVLDSVFNELADENKLKYFEKHPVNKGIVEALTRTVRELRLNGITSDKLKKGSFINPHKEGDMRLILAKYEKTLEEQKLVDGAILIMMALEQLGKKWGQSPPRGNPNLGDSPHFVTKSESKYFILSRYYMRGIEREFLVKLCGNDLTIIEEDPAIGLPLPSDSWSTGKVAEPDKCNSDIERLKWLFKSKGSPEALKDGTIELSSAIGYRNEVREALRHICDENTTVDDTEIIYTDAESYADLIYSLCEKLKMPVTFSEGLSSYMTAAGRAMLGFLLWVKEDFSEIYLRHVFESSGLEWESSKKSDMPGGTTLAFLLRTSGIGWGRERYTVVLDGQILETKQVAADLRKEGEDKDAERKDSKARDLAVLKEICEGLLTLVPPKDKTGKIDFGKFCEGCIMFLDKHVRKTGESDAAFVKIASERLAMLGGLIKGPMIFDEAMEKIFNAVSGIRVGASGPKPGHMHASHHRQGGRSGRGRTFIVGLDEGKFPAKAGQDPVLLDEERAKISDGLELSTERMSKNIYDMAALMAGLRGKVTFSYSAYDIKEDRKAFPSSILLQVFRIKEGDPSADYDTMLKSIGEPVGFAESPSGKIVLDETDWWLSRLIDGGVLKDGMDAVTDIYEGIQEGLTARRMRESDTLTEYDGKIKPHGGDLDPRQKADMVMSCSRLETAAKCPFAYFVANVLGVKKPDEVEKDTGAWLDAATRGKLLHEVFQIFINKTTGSKTKPSPREEEQSIEEILEGAISKYNALVPPPSDIVFKSECVQLKRDVGVFLQINRELGTEPVGTEVAFGDAKEGSVKIPLGEGKYISLRGKIDRIDKAAPSKYLVWDYKTGGTSYYEENGYVSGGEQIQHALYAVAAEAILRTRYKDKDAAVVAAGYIFPTEKGTKDGQGGIFPRPTDDKDRWREALNKLLDIIATGTFIVNNKDVCKFCDYMDICGGKTAQGLMSAKLENPENKALDPWKMLKEYE